MEKELKEWLSLARAKNVWQRTKNTLEYAHLAEFLLHLEHSQLLSLLVLMFIRPEGLVGLAWIGWMLFAYVLVKHHRRPRVDGTDGRKTERETVEPVVSTVVPTARVADQTPVNVAEIAALGCRITITEYRREITIQPP